MIKHEIFYFGLSRTELQTLRCRFPFSFQFLEIKAEDFEDDKKIQYMVSQAWCTFINPKKISRLQLESLIFEHECIIKHSHAALLLFTQPFTREQKRYIDTSNLHIVDLTSRFDRPIRDAEDIVRKATMPCWDGLKRMESNGFNDGWYLLDLETTGLDPTEDEVVSISIAYMENYEIKGYQTIYIKQKEPLSEDIQEITGITNNMLENGVTREEAVELLMNLHYNAPILVESYKYYVPFLKELFHLCGQKFDIPHVEIDGLAAIVFSYMWKRDAMDILDDLSDRRYPRTLIDHPGLAKLYGLTLAVFENLQDRYDVRAPLHFHSLYDGKVLCGD